MTDSYLNTFNIYEKKSSAVPKPDDYFNNTSYLGKVYGSLEPPMLPVFTKIYSDGKIKFNNSVFRIMNSTFTVSIWHSHYIIFSSI